MKFSKLAKKHQRSRLCGQSLENIKLWYQAAELLVQTYEFKQTFLSNVLKFIIFLHGNLHGNFGFRRSHSIQWDMKQLNQLKAMVMLPRLKWMSCLWLFLWIDQTEWMILVHPLQFICLTVKELSYTLKGVRYLLFTKKMSKWYEWEVKLILQPNHQGLVVRVVQYGQVIPHLKALDK